MVAVAIVVIIGSDWQKERVAEMSKKSIDCFHYNYAHVAPFSISLSCLFAADRTIT